MSRSRVDNDGDNVDFHWINGLSLTKQKAQSETKFWKYSISGIT